MQLRPTSKLPVPHLPVSLTCIQLAQLDVLQSRASCANWLLSSAESTPNFAYSQFGLSFLECGGRAQRRHRFSIVPCGQPSWAIAAVTDGDRRSSTFSSLARRPNKPFH